VTADGVSDVTDASGFYSVEVSPGIYDVTAEMTGYEPQTVMDVSVAADATVVQDFALAPEAVGVLSVMLDLNPNTLNLKSRGMWVTCYIEPPEGYSAEDIDFSTIMLGNVPVESRLKYGFVKNPVIEDRDGNGIPELMVKFGKQALLEYVRDVLGITWGDVALEVTGELTDGTQFKGSDTIKVVGADTNVFVPIRLIHLSRKRFLPEMSTMRIISASPMKIVFAHFASADINSDGLIDLFDALRLMNAFGATSGELHYNAHVDFNSDGHIDYLDLMAYLPDFP